MNIGTAGALALYSYQTTLNGYGQGSTGGSASTANSPSSTSASNPGSAQDAAILKALADTYTSLTTASNGYLPAPEALSALAGSSGVLGPLVNAIYSKASASGSTSLNLSALSASSASVGGLNSAAASTLFSGGGNSGPGALSSAAVNLNATLALASYSNYLKGVPAGSASAAAANQSTQPADVQAAIQSAQSTAFTSMLNLLA
jgi:hypothetical protein